MGDKSKIEWTDATWNPTRGCSRVSEGCRFCYAERFAPRVAVHAPFVRITPDGPRWTGEVSLADASHLALPARWKRPRKIFVNSMSDLYHEKLEFHEIDTVHDAMLAAPQHFYQILTKRVERMYQYYDSTSNRSDYLKMIPGLWLGVSAENQQMIESRVPWLLRTLPPIRWVSYEPALGPIDITSFRGLIDWVVAGAESGLARDARPAEDVWFRNLRDQCKRQGIYFFMKQRCFCGRKVAYDKFPADLQVRQYPPVNPAKESNPCQI